MHYSCLVNPQYPDWYLDHCETMLETTLQSVPGYNAWRSLDPGPDCALFTRFAALPSLVKRQMAEQGYAGFIPPGQELKRGLERGEVEIVQTSGSTGDRIANLWHQPWWDAAEQASWRLNSHSDRLMLGSHREAILTSPLCTGVVSEEGYLPMSERTQGRFLYLNERSDPTTWTESHMDRMVDEINLFAPGVIEANPSFLARLSRHIRNRKRRVRAPGLVVFSYENPSRLHYEQVRAVFDCPVASSYGSTEAGYVFMECEAGRLHQNMDFCHVDFLSWKPEHGGPLLGSILVTTFKNPWRALLRFDIGDLARLAVNPCSCGRTQGLVLESIEGRAVNLTLTPEGRPVTQGQADRRLSMIQGLVEYQVIQPDKTHYELRYVADAGVAERVAREAVAALKELYGPAAVISPARLETIRPDPPGKYRLTKALFDLDPDAFIDESCLPKKGA